MKRSVDTGGQHIWGMLPSPIGAIRLCAGPRGLVAIGLPAETRRPEPPPAPPAAGPAAAWLAEPIRQLDEYFAGKRREFDLALDPAGTPFQLAVWRGLCAIPYGRTWSYGELALRVGRPRAARAVGAALGANPLPIVVPCHRVIGADGSLTGFGGGLPVKRALLDLEGRA